MFGHGGFSFPGVGVQPFGEGIQAGAQLLPALGGAVRLDFQKGDGEFAAQVGVLKAVVVAKLQGVVDHALQAGGVVQGPAGGIVGHAHAGQLAQQAPGVVGHEGGEVRLVLGLCHVSVVGAGGVDHRQGHGLLHQGEEVAAHLGPQHRQVGLGDGGGGLEGGEEGRPVKLGAFVGPVGLGQGQQLVPGVFHGAVLPLVEDVQSALVLENVVGAADGVAAVDQHQFLHLAAHGRLDHRLAKAAQVGVGHLVGQVEVLRGLIQQGALAAKGRQQLGGGVFADVIGDAHAMPSNTSKKASTRVAAWPSPPKARSQLSPSSSRVGRPAASKAFLPRRAPPKVCLQPQ